MVPYSSTKGFANLEYEVVGDWVLHHGPILLLQLRVQAVHGSAHAAQGHMHNFVAFSGRCDGSGWMSVQT